MRNTLGSRVRRFGLALALLALAATVPAARASQVSVDVPSALALEGRIRPMLEDGSLASAIGAVAAIGGVDLDEEALAGIPSPVSVPSEVSVLRPELRDPIVSILEAATEGGRISSSAVDAPDDLFGMLDVLREWKGRAEPGSLPPEPLFDPTRVDRAELTRAGSLVARAVDDALPVLRRLAAERPPSSAAVAGCDVVDALPVLCVGSEAANTYSAEAVLHIDLGGDDVYTSSAGSAGPVPDRSPAAVLIDLAGDDRYEVSSSNRDSVAQGSGLLGGIGFLVDVEGNDTYRHWVGQGVGVYGVGVLADLSGDDHYSLDSRLGPAAINALGAGFSILGIGVFLDQAGNDVFTAVAESPRGAEYQSRKSSANFAIAYGDTVEGVALAWDGGGSDRAEIVARDRSPNDVWAWAEGFGVGWGLGSAGFALSGEGDTKRRIKIDVVANTASANGIGLGAGPGLGLGFLGDAGGDDSYEMRSWVRTSRSEGGIDIRAIAGADGRSVLHDASGDDHYLVKVIASNLGFPKPRWFNVWAMGSSVFGHGLLRDDAGGDVYEALIDNDRVVPRYQFNAQVQGAGRAGVGELHDFGGADRYVAIAHPGDDPLPPYHSLLWFAQGAGVGGTLIDLDDGQTDEFTSSPKRPVCLGTRGGAMWIECNDGVDGIGAGFGLVAP